MLLRHVIVKNRPAPFVLASEGASGVRNFGPSVWVYRGCGNVRGLTVVIKDLQEAIDRIAGDGDR
jgi:hypothetical protein